MTTPTHFADRLRAAVQTKGAPVCVGLDPVWDKLPEAVTAEDPVESLRSFSMAVLEQVAPIVPCVKPQAACYERYGAAGMGVYHQVVAEAKAMGLVVIGDVKRGDIGTSSAHYAAGLLSGDHGADALTVNGYLGLDGVQPFVDAASREGKGLFVLVRTSNPGGDALQSLPLADGRCVSDAVADLVAEAGQTHVGDSGDSLLGAVVGATKPQDAARLRERMPQQIFLVPGYGAQGGGAEDVKACFRPDGSGAIITASRSVIYAGERSDPRWAVKVGAAAERLRDEIALILR